MIKNLNQGNLDYFFNGNFFQLAIRNDVSKLKIEAFLHLQKVKPNQLL